MDGPFPYELEDARWWDEGLVQDFPPCGTGSLHVLPMLVKLTMEAKERKCVGCVISCFQDEDFEEAKGPPIQWRVRLIGAHTPGAFLGFDWKTEHAHIQHLKHKSKHRTHNTLENTSEEYIFI